MGAYLWHLLERTDERNRSIDALRKESTRYYACVCVCFKYELGSGRRVCPSPVLPCCLVQIVLIASARVAVNRDSRLRCKPCVNMTDANQTNGHALPVSVYFIEHTRNRPTCPEIR